ncbi:MAG: glycerol-3-phosphate 1-O-acyltransferase PlsY [Planctomycetota bacterium]|nr:glycerol-3-phosphate 1-O-acyltransferase PlsY [Planctomycetota bacterium]
MPPLFASPQGTEWIAILLSYLLGSVPFGLLLVRLVKGIDLRTVGSGNIGTANVGRVLGRYGALTAFVFDFGKGWVPAFVLAEQLRADGAGPWLPVLCGAAAVCGHVWPIFLGFKGGKAVATGFGALVALDPLIFVCGTTIWVLVLATTRFVGLSSMAMGVAFPVVAWLRMESGDFGKEVVWGAAALALLILVRHRSNLRRMMAGTEPRFGAPLSTKKTEQAG